jgi:hypothetical protein
MNHIHRLTAQVRELKAEQQAFAQGISNLVSYLSSSKFSCGSELDGYVQINEVLRRLETAKSNAVEVSFDYGNIYGSW